MDDQRECLLNNIYRDMRLEGELLDFFTSDERRIAWNSLSDLEKRKSIWETLNQFPEKKELVYNDAFAESMREAKQLFEFAREKKWFPNAKDLLYFIQGNLENLTESTKYTESVIYDRVVNLLMLRALALGQEDDKDSTSFWKSVQVPVEALVQTMSDERLQGFLQYIMEKRFLSQVSRSTLPYYIQEWYDMYRRRCLRYLDPDHPQLIQNNGDHDALKEFKQVIRKELTRDRHSAGLLAQ